MTCGENVDKAVEKATIAAILVAVKMKARGPHLEQSLDSLMELLAKVTPMDRKV